MKRCALLLGAIVISIQATGCGTDNTQAADRPAITTTLAPQPNAKGAKGARGFPNPANPVGRHNK
jgi:hypothetical protein